MTGELAGGACTTGPYLLFDLASSEGDLYAGTFALSVASVFQVIEPAEITKVPLAPSLVLGILNHHGRIVTVVDPGPLFMLGRQPDGVTMAVVLRQGLHGPLSLALQVVRVRGLVKHEELSPVAVEPRPAVAWSARRGSGLVQVVAVGALLERLGRLFESHDIRQSPQGATV